MPNITLVVGLGYGDEGKGKIVSALTKCTKAELIVRFNGGPQTAHNVVTDAGEHHTFRQFGSGTFSGTTTFYARPAILDPYALCVEAEALHKLGAIGSNLLWDFYADRECLIVTPYHAAVNKLREIARGAHNHGSCGRGIGEARQDEIRDFGYASLYLKDFLYSDVSAARLAKVREWQQIKIHGLQLPNTEEVRSLESFLEDPQAFEDMCAFYHDFAINVLKPEHMVCGNDWLKQWLKQTSRPVIFEGAQGVLLDETYGFQPHTTWTNTTFDNAFALLQESDYQGEVTKLGVTRMYATRHGPGPFVSEWKGIAAATELHNGSGRWQGKFRVGPLDMLTLRYAVNVCNGIDALALTCVDQQNALMGNSVVYTDSYNVEMVDPYLRRRFFDADREVAHAIKVSDPTDFERQTHLALQLEKCLPNTSGLMPADFKEYLEEQVGSTQITITSHGPQISATKFVK